MKTQYEAERPRLTTEEHEEVWDRIVSSVPTSNAGARRVILSLTAVGAAAAVVLLALLPPHRDGSTGSTDLSALEDSSSKSGQVTQQGSSSTEPLAASSASPEPAGTVGQDRPAAVESSAAQSHRAAGSEGARSSNVPIPAEPVAPPTPSPPAEETLAIASAADSVTAVPAAIGDSAETAQARPGRARAGTIRGIVQDSDGRPLPYANVMILGAPWGAMSNDSGVFSIRNVPVGIYSLRATYVGYEDLQVDSVRVLPDLAANLDVTLKQRTVGIMDLVEITAARERIKMKSTQTRHDSRTSGVEYLACEDLTDPIGLKAGAVARGEQLHFRGGRAGEIRYQVDGTPVRDPKAGCGPKATKQSQPVAPPPVIPVTGGSTLPNDEVYDSMYFEHYGVNPFIATEEDSLSTFAVDVDAASYTIARRTIELGHLPDKDAVRVEEFINFFKQGYPEFHEPDFQILIDGAPSAFGPGYHLVRIGLKARTIDTEHRKPANLVFVIDVSGSMAREDRLELVKKALEILVGKLREGDRVGLVVYDTFAHVVMEPVSTDKSGELLRAIRGLHPGSSTNAEAGLLLGYEMARRNYEQAKINRIILCADGVANEGVTSAEAILDRVRHESDRGIALSTIGFGMGNYNDVLMEKLADQGDGAYYYVDRLEEAARIFEENLTGTLQTIARDVKVQVAFDPCLVARYRLLGFENRDIADRDFRNDRVDAGEIGAGHEMTALYELKLLGDTPEGRIATVRLRYARPEGDSAGPLEIREIATRFDASSLARSFDEACPRFRLDAAAAEFAEILRHSFWAKDSRIADLLPVTRSIAAELSSDPDVREFASMVEKATGLSDTRSPEERERLAPPRR